MIRRWRPEALSWVAVIAAMVGIGVFLYPFAAAWTAAVAQSAVIDRYTADVQEDDPAAAAQLAAARAYNAALSAGVELEAHASVPVGSGAASSRLDYERMLSSDPAGVMARIRIPSVDVDLPVFHGTNAATLLRGAGHLEGSHLPVGGAGTHAVITAHRGLAEATMFSDLDHVRVGDRFTIEVRGEVLSYQVVETRVVAPEDTESLRSTSGEDLVTLVTCTPLGINSHRILVTGARISPTPPEDLRAAGADADAGFAWWAVAAAAGLLCGVAAIRRLGFADAARR